MKKLKLNTLTIEKLSVLSSNETNTITGGLRRHLPCPDGFCQIDDWVGRISLRWYDTRSRKPYHGPDDYLNLIGPILGPGLDGSYP